MHETRETREHVGYGASEAGEHETRETREQIGNETRAARARRARNLADSSASTIKSFGRVDCKLVKEKKTCANQHILNRLYINAIQTVRCPFSYLQFR